jgi:CRP-like cAMP-binding protein
MRYVVRELSGRPSVRLEFVEVDVLFREIHKKGQTLSDATGNLLLDSLSTELRRSVLALSKPMDLPLRTMLHEQGEMPTYAYFLGLMGREGLVGALHIIGPTPAPAQCFMQMEGNGIRIRLDDLRNCFQSDGELRQRVLEFVQQQAVTLEQIAACNKLHQAEERLARWLLMAHDRAGNDTMTMTQEFLADMLGTRRTTVTLVAGSLQRRGLIDYKRAKITILDREGLEEASCDCYKVIKDALTRLYQ